MSAKIEILKPTESGLYIDIFCQIRITRGGSAEPLSPRRVLTDYGAAPVQHHCIFVEFLCIFINIIWVYAKIARRTFASRDFSRLYIIHSGINNINNNYWNRTFYRGPRRIVCQPSGLFISARLRRPRLIYHNNNGDWSKISLMYYTYFSFISFVLGSVLAYKHDFSIFIFSCRTRVVLVKIVKNILDNTNFNIVAGSILSVWLIIFCFHSKREHHFRLYDLLKKKKV